MRSLKFLLGVILIHFAASAHAIEEGEVAPGLEAKLLDGRSFSLANERGNVVVVNFWATWCEPCRAEMPALDAFYRQLKAQGLEVVAISMDQPGDDAKVREVMRAFTFDAGLGREASFRGYGRIWRLPLTFVIDRRGILRKDGWYGKAGIDQAMLEGTVAPLLAEKPGQ